MHVISFVMNGTYSSMQKHYSHASKNSKQEWTSGPLFSVKVFLHWLSYLLQTLFGKEADRLEQATANEATCILFTFEFYGMVTFMHNYGYIKGATCILFSFEFYRMVTFMHNYGYIKGATCILFSFYGMLNIHNTWI